MPSPLRDTDAVVSPGIAAGDLRERAVDVLLHPSLSRVVELVAWRDGDEVHVAGGVGEVAYPLRAPFDARVVRGRNPVGHQDPQALLAVEGEQPDPWPGPERDSYPLAAERLAGLFADADRAPDLAVVHTDAHHWPERGGHLGEHGSLGVLQSRAPFLLSGAGVSKQGVVDGHARTVDVMPTLLALAGVQVPEGLDGQARTDLFEPGVASHVVGLLWDGGHSDDVLHLAATGDLPNVARLLADGVALRGGAVAAFPSVTLANHTSCLTGLYPGRHGIVNNTYFDRATHRQVKANDVATWHRAGDLLRPGVRTLWEVLAEQRPGVFTACVDEPTDRGAVYSTFDLIRQASSETGALTLGDNLPPFDAVPRRSTGWADQPDYVWSTRIDHLGVEQMKGVWAAPEPPAVSWWNTTLTDSGHHAGGPRSEIARDALRDSDARLGELLDAIDARGLLGRTAFLLVADHGFAVADPTCTGDYGAALAAARIPFRDEAEGFLYLGADAVAGAAADLDPAVAA